ncbi:MAG: Gfo/Idh/MocA family oxidoreductase [Candidatus Omnitrophica bacterium]|nr:Gfo/Idh/MocA family oxidoreductase [Candidatus Omnitrophota bacterium]
MKKLRIGIIGLGAMGYGHCKNVRSINDVVLTCVCDNSEELAKSRGQEFSVPYFIDSKKLIDSGLCDAVIVVVPHWFHPDISIYAFRKGLHVLCEKPLAVIVSDAERMVKEAKKYNKIFAVMHQMRTEPFFIKAKEIIESGNIGKIHRTVCVDLWYRSQAYYDSGSWRATWKGEGGGVLVNQAPHIIDLFIALAGLPVRVEAKTRTRLHKIEVEDEVCAFLEYKNGARGYYYTTTCEPVRNFYIEIAGEKGKLIIDGYKIKLYRYNAPVSVFTRKAKKMWESIEAKEEVYQFESNASTGQKEIIKNFAQAILNKEKLFATGLDGLNTIEFINACILSGQKGKTVEIPVKRKEYDRLMENLKKLSKPKKNVKIQIETDPRLLK